VAADSLCVGVGVGAGTGVPLSVLLVAKVLGAKQNFNSWPLQSVDNCHINCAGTRGKMCENYKIFYYKHSSTTSEPISS